MPTIVLEDTRATLAELIDRCPPGEEVVITRNGKPVATLKTASAAEPLPPAWAAWVESGRPLEMHSPIFAVETAAVIQQLLDNERAVT